MANKERNTQTDFHPKMKLWVKVDCTFLISPWVDTAQKLEILQSEFEISLLAIWKRDKKLQPASN